MKKFNSGWPHVFLVKPLLSTILCGFRQLLRCRLLYWNFISGFHRQSPVHKGLLVWLSLLLCKLFTTRPLSLLTVVQNPFLLGNHNCSQQQPVYKILSISSKTIASADQKYLLTFHGSSIAIEAFSNQLHLRWKILLLRMKFTAANQLAHFNPKIYL